MNPMKHLLALLVLAVSAQAQIVWGPPIPFDTGLTGTNGADCQPISNEPTLAVPVFLPLPPDGTDIYRITWGPRSYGATIRCTNTSSGAASYTFGQLHRWYVGHKPGLWYWWGGAQEGYRLAGFGHDAQAATDAWVGNSSAGATFGLFHTMEPFSTDTRIYERTFTTTDIDLNVIDADWMIPNRRGGHTLWVTPTGDYNWSWSWGNGQPADFVGHTPLPYSVESLWLRARGTIEYGSWTE